MHHQWYADASPELSHDAWRRQEADIERSRLAREAEEMEADEFGDQPTAAAWWWPPPTPAELIAEQLAADARDTANEIAAAMKARAERSNATRADLIAAHLATDACRTAREIAATLPKQPRRKRLA